MKKNYLRQISCLGRMALKWWLCLLLGGMLNLPATAQQNTAPRVNLKVEKTSLIHVIEALRSQTRYNFLFNSKDLQPYTDISVHLQSVTLQQALDSLLTGRKTRLEYTIEGETVVIRKKRIQEQQQGTVNGRVTDNRGQALPGVTVLIEGTSLGTSTDMEGNYSLTSLQEGAVLLFTMVGMETKKEAVGKRSVVNVVMQEAVNELEDVVVTGVFTKARESYTGAATTITSSDLKRVGNRNILSSIRNIDPSFHIVDNPAAGSDPNSLPDITIRGNSSMTSNVKDLQTESQATQSANMPLFILDGFEITLERMMDLDENQVESITLLKDASATAMYGTRGANGVVVITTRQPEAGKLQLTYKGWRSRHPT